MKETRPGGRLREIGVEEFFEPSKGGVAVSFPKRDFREPTDDFEIGRFGFMEPFQDFQSAAIVAFPTEYVGKLTQCLRIVRACRERDADFLFRRFEVFPHRMPVGEPKMVVRREGQSLVELDGVGDAIGGRENAGEFFANAWFRRRSGRDFVEQFLGLLFVAGADEDPREPSENVAGRSSASFFEDRLGDLPRGFLFAVADGFGRRDGVDEGRPGFLVDRGEDRASRR